MGKAKGLIAFLFVVACVVFFMTLLSDKQDLRQQVIRLHVVGASNSDADQAVKLQVRDKVLEYLQQGLSAFPDAGEAKRYLQSQLPKLQQLANDTLRSLGIDQEAVVTFFREEFPTRIYDTFQLPSGVYESLKITIGPGEGENWWCVVFPRLCMQSTVNDVEDAAVGAGFSHSLTGSITRQPSYQVRFFFLEVLGKIENFFHR